jgi:hypothetical protein
MRRLAIVVAMGLAGCGGDDDAGGENRPPPDRDRAAVGGPPDAGTEFGHGGGDDTQRTTVRVPERDTTPPTARISFAPGNGRARVVEVSPSKAGDRPDQVDLPGPRFLATAEARDEEGTGRIRLSVTYVVRCGERERRVTRYHPPAQIAGVKLRPGATAPVERTRTEITKLDLDPGCSAEGEAWAEATNAHGLQSVSRHVGFRYEARRG